MHNVVSREKNMTEIISMLVLGGLFCLALAIFVEKD